MTDVSIALIRKRLFVEMEKKKIGRDNIEHFQQIHYYQMWKQIYDKVIDAIERILAAPDATFFIQARDVAQELKDNPVIDTQHNEFFFCYEGVTELFVAAFLDKAADAELMCRHEHIRHSGFVHCEDCCTEFGWACPTSPDKRCHYYTFAFPDEETGILLLNGEILKREPDDYETQDCCFFCGDPKERK